MSNKVFTLSFTSRRIYFIRGFLSIAIGLSITLLIVTSLRAHLNVIAFLGLNFLITGLLYYLSRGWHKGQVEVRFTDNELEITSYIPLLRLKKQYSFQWKNITELNFSETQYFWVMKIKDKEKKVAFAVDFGDEFSLLEQGINKEISKWNQDGIGRIRNKRSINETKVGISISVIFILLMIGWPIAVWFNDKDFKIGLALIFYSSAGFFIYKVYHYIKQKKSSE